MCRRRLCTTPCGTPHGPTTARTTSCAKNTLVTAPHDIAHDGPHDVVSPKALRHDGSHDDVREEILGHDASHDASHVVAHDAVGASSADALAQEDPDGRTARR